MTSVGRTVCPFCLREVGCYVPAGGDGTGMLLRLHRAHRAIKAACTGSRHLVTEWDQVSR